VLDRTQVLHFEAVKQHADLLSVWFLGFQALTMEPAIRIERATCGLRISPDTSSDNLTPHKTTNQDTSNMGLDGDSLSCSGSSVVAEVGG